MIFLTMKFDVLNLGNVELSGFAFEGAGNGPVVITWIGREHDL